MLTDEQIKALGENNTRDLKKEEEEEKNKLIIAYRNIIDILKEYCDLREDYYNIVALWIIGTYFHKQFPTYPYLFLNAMKGSGKTRTLKLITFLAKEGDMLNSLTEAVLFRSQGALAIDEFEGITRKGNEALRELLNSAYKKGTKVKRMKKKKTMEGEEQVVEEFDVYRPIVIANIWGMESVLGDRCVTLILEKSNKKEIVNLMEIYERDFKALETKKLLMEFGQSSVVCVDVVSLENIYKEWNNYVRMGTCNYTNYTNNIYNINNTNYIELFKSIKSSFLTGRELEISFPLLLISDMVGTLDETLLSITTLMKERREEDLTENKDISLIDFLSQEIEREEFVTVKQLLVKFKDYLQSEDDWINTKWLGRALKRLNLIKEKRRKGRGIEVIPNYKKAQDKIKMFK